jgi:hypothetical protein
MEQIGPFVTAFLDPFLHTDHKSFATLGLKVLHMPFELAQISGQLLALKYHPDKAGLVRVIL